MTNTETTHEGFLPRVSLSSQAVLLAVSSGLAQVLVAAVFISAARSTSPSAFGTTASAIAIGGTVAGVLDFGCSSLWVRERARGSMSLDALSRAVTQKFAIVGGLLLALGLIGALVSSLTLAAIACGVAMGQIMSLTAQVPLRACGRGELVSIAVVFDRLVAVAVFFSACAMAPPLAALGLALTVGSVSGALIAWRLTPKPLRPQPRLLPWGNPWAGSTHFGAAALGLSAQALDLPLMASVSSPAAAGVYAAVNRWTQPMGLLANAFARASSPYVARTGDLVQAMRAVRRGLWLPLLACLGCLLVVPLAPRAVDLLVGAQYESSASVLQVLAIGTIPGICNQILAVGLQSLGYDRYVSRVLIGGVVLQLVLVVVLSARMGAMGAALAFLILQLAMLAFLLAPLKGGAGGKESRAP